MQYLDRFRFCPVCGAGDFKENDFKSKRCSSCGFTYYFNSSAAAVALIENEKGELLLCRRGCEPAKGTLDLIGGFVDPGETSEEAVVREIKEETGINILDFYNMEDISKQFLFSLPNTYNYSNLIIHTTDAFFHIVIPSATKLEAHDDVAETFWVSPKDIKLEDVGLDSIRDGLKRWLNK